MIQRQFLHTAPLRIWYLRDGPRSPVDAARIRAVDAGLDAAM
jgi:hypothetical protein